LKLDIFRAFIIAQPFLWIWIIEDDRWEFLNEDIYLFYSQILFCFLIFIIPAFKIKIDFFTTELLFLYTGMIWITNLVLIREFKYSFRKAIANSFLIVYLNSFYWESFLHIWVILESGFNRNQFFQALHLIPAFYFLMRYRFDRRIAVDQLGKGFFISTVIGFSRQFRIWQYLPIEHTAQTVYFFNHGLMILNRLICWVFLFNAIIIWGMHKSDYRKLMRQTKRLYTQKTDSSLVV